MKKKLLSFTILLLTLFTNHTIYLAEELTINTPHAILMDANSGQILYEKNANSKTYPASITKLMTALLAIETLQPDDTITFSHNAIFSLEPGANHIGLKEGEILTVDQTLHALLLMSANDAANGLAEKVSGTLSNFSIKMNQRAKELGATNTNFVNAHGLHDDNHCTTAHDMALIAKEISKNKYFLKIMKDIKYQIPSTNKDSEITYLAQQHKLMNQFKYPKTYRNDVIGGKIGYTSKAKHTLVTIAEKNGKKLITVILNTDATTLYTDTNTLLDYGFNSYKPTMISKADYKTTLKIVNTKKNNLEKIGSAKISLANTIPILLNKNTLKNDLTSKVELPEYLTSDCKLNDVVGSISYFYNNTFVGKSDLIISDLNVINESAIKTTTKKFFSFSNIIKNIILAFIILLIIRILKNKKKLTNRRRKRRFRSSNTYSKKRY